MTHCLTDKHFIMTNSHLMGGFCFFGGGEILSKLLSQIP